MKNSNRSGAVWHLWEVVCALAFCGLLVGCNGKEKNSGGGLFGATGKPLDMVVVIPETYDSPALRDSVAEAMGYPMPILPQAEPMLSLMYVGERSFGQMFKSLRNVLYISIDPERYTRPSVGVSRDPYADGQLMLHARAGSVEGIYRLLKARGVALGRMVHREELQRLSKSFTTTYSSKVAGILEETIGGYTINVSNDLDFTNVAENFVWASDQGQKGRTDLLIYTYPYEGEKSLMPERIVAVRDSVLAQHVPGSREGSYMATEHRVTPMVTSFQYGSQDGVELRGLWRMEGDMMGGPFVLHAMVDEERGRVIVGEVLVYYPAGKKKSLLMAAEGQLATLRPVGQSINALFEKFEE